jgi:hypothetical protein
MTFSCLLTLNRESCIEPPEVVKFYWQTFHQLVLQAAADSADSPQLFDVLVKVFEDANRSEPDESTLLTYLTTWSDALLAHKHTEVV